MLKHLNSDLSCTPAFKYEDTVRKSNEKLREHKIKFQRAGVKSETQVQNQKHDKQLGKTTAKL